MDRDRSADELPVEDRMERRALGQDDVKAPRRTPDDFGQHEGRVGRDGEATEKTEHGLAQTRRRCPKRTFGRKAVERLLETDARATERVLDVRLERLRLGEGDRELVGRP